jgi:hypothetical protein
MVEASLTEILAHARAGSAERAWRLFTASGYDRVYDDPATLAVKGRLLKDQARAAASVERDRLYTAAAGAYRHAGDLSHASYHLVNSAACALLGRDHRQAESSARRVLELVEANPDEAETPYWRLATRAEALLLLDRDEEARGAFAEAVALAPQAWEDHASTLRQFALIHQAKGKDAAWLDAHRPPRSLHFGGHMSFDARLSRREHLDEEIAAVLDEERIGFGYGALAAGADIIVAEALVERGAELHAVLPGGAEAFAAVSVDPLGKAWRKRFDALVSLAATIRPVRPLGTPPDRMTVMLADEIAMGAAAMNARRLESVALQLLVVDAEGESSDASSRWAEAGWRQRLIAAPREASAGAAAALPAAPHGRLAILTVAAEAEQGLAALAAPLAGAPAAALGPYFTGREVVLAYAEPDSAAGVALTLAREAGAAVGGHYGVADPVPDPFGGALRLGGEPAALASAAAASAPAGSVCVTADFALALAAGRAPVRAELIGELDSRAGGDPVELYALKPDL